MNNVEMHIGELTKFIFSSLTPLHQTLDIESDTAADNANPSLPLSFQVRF